MAFDSFVAELNKYSGLPYPLRAAAFNLRNHFQRHLLFHAVYGRAFVEYRFPYCDLPLLTFCFGLPYEFGDERRLQKAIIAREMPYLASIGCSDDELPISNRRQARRVAEIRQKVKRGIRRIASLNVPERPTLYANYENWLRGDLRLWAENILFDKRTLERGIFRPQALHSLINRHLTGHEHATIGKIAPLISYELMLRRFID